MSKINQMPKEKEIDNTLHFLREGYMYISNRVNSFNSDVFETRLLGKRAICMRGKEAAELFYDTEKFQRKNTAPNRVVKTLFGKNGVQGLDGQTHKHRKEMFMSIMSHENVKRLMDITKEQWEIEVEKWERMDQVILYKEAQEMLCRIACEWAGVPIKEDEVKKLSKELGSLFESAGKVGPVHWLGRNARSSVEKWVGELIEKVRDGKMAPPENTTLHIIAMHRDLEGNLLDIKTAAVEVVNILRPIVAISIYINFTALAVYHYPEERKRLETGEQKHAQMFVQEVRRFYPFFPSLIALVKRDFIWNSYTFKKGTLTLLDIYGTNRHPEIWDNPDVFKPDRFANWDESPFSFIPQGGGDYYIGHRCAGEWVTLEVMKVSLDFLANRMNYEVPDQDLSYSMVSMPSVPRSKVVLKMGEG